MNIHPSLNNFRGCLVFTLILLGFLTPSSGKAAITIIWGAQVDAGLGLADGSPVAVGSALKLGYYTTAVNSSTFLAYSTASQFLTNFVTLANGVMGLDVDSNTSTPNEPGYFASGASLLTGDSSADGKKLYYLIGNNSVFANSTELGVFTSSLANWTLINNPSGPTPTVVNTDIRQVASSDILFGSGPVAAAAAYGSEYRLQVVPEPGVASLLLVGLAMISQLRNRRKK